jgi:hypothetical protein
MSFLSVTTLGVSSATIFLMMFCASMLFFTVLPHLHMCREFVNSVSCINLSPQEMQQMGKQGLELLSSPLGKRLGSSSCNDYAGAKESEHQDHVCRFGRSQVLKRSRSQLKASSAAYVSTALSFP